MARYRLITLVDITRSNPQRSEIDTVKIGQQANFNSLVQAIGLRANVSWAVDPTEFNGSLPHPIEGKASHWVWIFEVERPDTFLKADDPVGLLIEDLHGVPIVSELNNTAIIDPAIFQTKGPQTNVWVSELE